MMVSRVAGWLVVAAVLGQALSGPVARLEPDGRPLAVVSDLGQRLASRGRFQDAGDPRLSIPTPQDLEAIKKVAQILVMLGEQIIPTLIGDSQRPPPHATPSGAGAAAVVDIPNDTVDHN